MRIIFIVYSIVAKAVDIYCNYSPEKKNNERNKTIKGTFKKMDEITDKYREEKIGLIKKMVKENLEDMEKNKIKDRISWIDGYLDAYTILKEQFNLL